MSMRALLAAVAIVGAVTISADARKAIAQQQSSDRYLVVANAEWSSSLEAAVIQLGGFVSWSSNELGIAVAFGLDEVAAEQLEDRSDVAHVELEQHYSLPETSLGGVAPVIAPPSSAGANPMGAAFYEWQWNMRAIRAEEAWNAGRFGSQGVTVAVLDSGVDYLVPDLAGRVDLSRSISLVPHEDPLVSSTFPGRHPVTDLNGHGTLVSAIISSNAQLLAGVTRDTTLIGVKVCDYTGDCLEGSTLAGIVHAVDAGADVINMSIGAYGGSIARRDLPGLMSAINRAVNYAHQNRVTIVAAAGNDAVDMNTNGNDFIGYCDAPHVICVSATGATFGGIGGPWPDVDSFANYSNSGSRVTVAAPGGQIVQPPPSNEFSVVWGPCPTTLINPGFLQSLFCHLGIFPSVGTSMATPAVSGLAALLVAENGKNPQKIAKALKKGAVDLGKPGRDRLYGFGRIDVAATLGLQ